jgi:hypothetical protein
MSITARKHHAAAVVVTNFTGSGGATVTLEGSMDGITCSPCLTAAPSA